MLTTSFTYSAVCLNTLFFYKVNLHCFKVQSAKTMVSIVVLVGQDLRDGSGNNRCGYFSLASLTGSEERYMREWWKCYFKAMVLLYKCNCLLVLVIGFNLLLHKKGWERRLECMLRMLTATDINSPVYKMLCLHLFLPLRKHQRESFTSLFPITWRQCGLFLRKLSNKRKRSWPLKRPHSLQTVSGWNLQ